MVLSSGRYTDRLIGLLVCLCSLMLVTTSAALADEPEAAGQKASKFPEVSKVAPYVTDLQKEAAALQFELASRTSLDQVRERLSETDERFRGLVKRMAELGDVETWYSDRLLDFDERLRVQHQTFSSIQEELTSELGRLESYRLTWEDKRSYLENWREFLKSEGSKVPGELFRQALETTDSVLLEINSAQKPLLGLQQRVASVMSEVQQKRADLESSLKTVRTEVFRKNSHSFFSKEFYRQFNPAMLDEIRNGIGSALTLGNDFLRRFGMLIGIQLLLALLLPLLIYRFHSLAEQPDEWAFLLRHPWATGIFVAVASLSFFYEAPPQLLRFALYAFGVGSLAILIDALTPSRRRGLVVLSLSVLFLISTALRMISLPLPLYRSYLLVLYLIGAPVLWWVSLRARQARGKVTSFVFALRLGAILVAVALLAQLAGFVNLSFGLVQASIETLFAYLFLLMALKLGFGAIGFLLGLKWLKERHFISQHGWQLSLRLKKIFRLACSVYVLLFLSQVWGVFDTVADAWETMLNWAISVGEAELSLRMVLLAGITLYLTYQLSWFLQASIDTQLLQRREVDRGVRDAIKKLIHYALILLGFMLAISALGFQLQHLVVLAGAFGVGIGFGLQDIVNNFLSGLILLFERPVKVGDGILIDGEFGTVVKIGLRSTVVETLDQSELIVPNSQIISQKVTNWTLSTRRVRVVVPVGVAYGSDVELVLKILVEAGEKHQEVLEEPAPSPIFSGFGDSSLDFELRVWIPNVDMRPRVKSDLLVYIDRRFREENVEIPFPQRDLHLRSVDDKLLGALEKERKE